MKGAKGFFLMGIWKGGEEIFLNFVFILFSALVIILPLVFYLPYYLPTLRSLPL